MKIGLLSDIHYFDRPFRLRSALRLLAGSEVILIAGDITHQGTGQQFSGVIDILKEEVPDTAIFPVRGNHDIRESEDAYGIFEEIVFSRFSSVCPVEKSKTGAYSVRLDEETDLIGLNPLYHMKLFHFPEHGEQLAFLESCLKTSTAGHHIVLCHPPLIAHNPQRTPDMTPYLPKEQDDRLQRILEAYGNILFLSGHTHFVPTIEQDEKHHVVYINDGSIPPTTAGKNGETQPGNVFRICTDGGACQWEVVPLTR